MRTNKICLDQILKKRLKKIRKWSVLLRIEPEISRMRSDHVNTVANVHFAIKPSIPCILYVCPSVVTNKYAEDWLVFIVGLYWYFRSAVNSLV